MPHPSQALHLLHVIPRLSLGGAGRSLVELLKRPPASREVRATVLSLAPAEPAACAAAASLGAAVLDAPQSESWARTVEAVDVVLLHFWNSPEVYRFLQSGLPPMRLVLWLKVMGDRAPHALPGALLEFSDRIIATTPGTLALPELAAHRQKTDMVPAIADFGRVAGLVPRPHPHFTVSYVGTADFVKLHRGFVGLCAGIRVPGIRFQVCGSGAAYPVLAREAAARGVSDRFEWRGHVEDIGAVLEVSDVFGYPLCEDTYATSEKSLQEAMLAGVPPVVFPHGGIRDLVRDGHNGLVARTDREYREAVEYLYRQPEVRAELGRQAARDVRARFDPDAAAAALHQACVRLLQAPKRPRLWGPDPGPVIGADSFIRSLGGRAPQFAASRYGSVPEALLAADRTIGASSPVLSSAGAGGILHYRSCYPNDPYLRLWAGLVLQRMERPALALAEFSAAARLGLDHWRVFWYQAEAARGCGARVLAEEAEARLARLAPGFARDRGII